MVDESGVAEVERGVVDVISSKYRGGAGETASQGNVQSA